MRLRLLLAVPLLASLLLAGCQTVETRIKQQPEVFASLDKATQDRIKNGVIGIGYTENMVYLALGAPDQKRESLTASAHTLTWIYNSYSTHYYGPPMMGYPYGYYPYYARYPLYRPYAYHPYYPSYYGDAYYTETEERIRVTFNEGKVTAIDQVHD
jgi:hypothetical protein